MQRVVILTDIEADPDDAQTLVRLLLYSNKIDIRAIVATTSTHMRTRVAPESIRRIISAYAEVRDNLLLNSSGYPRAETLLARVSAAQPMYGIEAVGEGKDSEGSEAILRELEREDERPLWVSVWGGTNTLAQALWKLRATLGPDELTKRISKLRVYTISDQDDSGIWIRRNFPDLFYIVSPGGYGNGTWGGIHEVVKGIDNTSISNKWLATNIQQGYGPLGASYPDVAYGMEGDTPAWLGLLPNGLNVPERPDWGGWGGRYEFYRPERADIDPDGFTGAVPVENEPRPIWTNAVDTWSPFQPGSYGRSVQWDANVFTGHRVTLWRWRDDFQNDFAARMDWCIRAPEQCNHPPLAADSGIVEMTVKAGQGFVMEAGEWSDPDGDNLGYLWFAYPEAGSWKKPLPLGSAENLHSVYVVAPVVTEPETLHFILRVTDKGTPPLSRYKRYIVSVLP